MKNLIKIVSVLTLFSSMSFAADLNLEGGDSAVIRANVETTVTCGGSSSYKACESKANAMGRSIESCLKASNSNISSCVRGLFQDWKKLNPSCLSEGSSICTEKCIEGSGYVESCISYCK